MKTFKIDEWFPIKRLETEDNKKEYYQSYSAKVIMEYTATRKLEANKPLVSKMPRSELYRDITLGLKEKMAHLNAKIDAFENERAPL